jgi:hypothetical protein
VWIDMGTILGLLGLAVAAVVLAALAVVAVRAVGPFVDGTAVFRAGPRNAPPFGTQEEDPPRWDFTAMHTGETTERHPAGRAPGDPTGTHAP